MRNLAPDNAMSGTTTFVQRAHSHLEARQLTFSCYRIRRRFALPLPITQLPVLNAQIRGFSQPYPWQIWCLWALEERLYTLGGGCRVFG